MNNTPPVPHMGPHLPSHPSRRHSEYHYQQQQRQHHPQQYQYSGYHHQQYHGPPPPQYIPQWYPPYQHYNPPPPTPQHAHSAQPPRQFQPQSPLVVSSHPNAQPFVPAFRQPQQTPQPSRTPLPEQSTPSTASNAINSPSTTPTTAASISTPTPPIPSSKAPLPASPTSLQAERTPFYPQLPWYSVPESSFPSKPRRRPRRRKPAELPSETPEFPSRAPTQASSDEVQSEPEQILATPPVPTSSDTTQLPTPQQQPPQPELIPSTVTPASTAPAPSPAPAAQPAQAHRRAPTIPAVPIIPSLPRKAALSPPVLPSSSRPESTIVTSPTNEGKPVQDSNANSTAVDDELPAAAPLPKAPPKSWAELLRSKQNAANGVVATASLSNGVTTNGIKPAKSGSLSDALRLYDVENDSKISFLEPRGLVNTGNMCYMNSILQVLVFCIPFFELLDRVGKRAVHSFKSNTPLVEAMIMFMREYAVIDSAASVEQLRMRLKDGELEQYGEPFIPEYVYEAIKQLPRFSSMRRGQQQDAEEFLGLLLEVLHIECLSVMGEIDSSNASSAASDGASDRSSEATPSTDTSGWMEVQHKQKPAITRSSGADTESPITKIFGGKLRSEFRVAGNKNSVTLTQYQQLQLDIGDSSVCNISDALKGLARSERVDGAFQTTRGTATSGTKQSFLETLPPVLILHLKRFHYEGNATQKIWKRIGYPLELEIPREVFAPTKRAQFAARPQGPGSPRYRLIGVVYHHGKHASGGHYTVDVRRQEGREWIRLDDTVIHRVRAEDVAGEGGEEDPKSLAAALEQHKRDESATKANIFNKAGFATDDNVGVTGDAALVDANEEGDAGAGQGGGWSQVNGTHGHTSPIAATSLSAEKKRATANGVVNTGTATPSTSGKRTPREKDMISSATANTASMASRHTAKDNKVAYILFYQQIKT